jgi:hypothetical protein
VLRDLTAGSHLLLPFARNGARVWIGDVHALQGSLPAAQVPHQATFAAASSSPAFPQISPPRPRAAPASRLDVPESRP